MRVHHFVFARVFDLLADAESTYDSRGFVGSEYVRRSQYSPRQGLKEEIPCHFCSAD